MAKSIEDLGPVQMPANKVIVIIGASGFSTMDSDTAQDTLIRYFSLLSRRDYAGAVELYGGGYEILEEWNPTADPKDLAGLLEKACMVNGLWCLPVKKITLMITNDPKIYEFIVQFQQPDGRLLIVDHEREWADDDLPRSSFKFTVASKEDGYVVIDLPVYTP